MTIFHSYSLPSSWAGIYLPNSNSCIPFADVEAVQKPPSFNVIKHLTLNIPGRIWEDFTEW